MRSGRSPRPQTCSHSAPSRSTAASPHEVHRADDVVPLARLEEARDAVLAAAHVVGLDAEPQVGLLAHERAVVVDVVARPAAPPRVLPDLERLREAVDVLGDAELGDPALVRGLAVALGVGRGEVALRRRVRRRRGAGGRGSRSAQQALGDRQVVRRRHLEVGGRGLYDAHAAPGALDEPGVVGRLREHVGRHVERAPQRRRRGTPAASGSPTGASGRACARRARPARPP